MKKGAESTPEAPYSYLNHLKQKVVGSNPVEIIGFLGDLIL
jgi:hypothetical protein